MCSMRSRTNSMCPMSMVQDVFMCLFRNVGGLREPKSLKAFVISITAMTIKYELRQRRVRRWIHLSGAVSDLEGPRTEQPDAGALQRCGVARVAAIGDLGP